MTAIPAPEQPEWRMIKKIGILFGALASVIAVLGGAVYGIWILAITFSAITGGIADLQQKGLDRDKKVEAVKAALEDPGTGINKTLSDHWRVIQQTQSDVASIKTGIGTLANQLSDFAEKATGTPPKPRK